MVHYPSINIDYATLWGPFAAKEYSNGNFGLSKDMFELINSKVPTYPQAAYYLAEIHSNVGIFKDEKKAIDYYLKFVNNKSNKNVITTQMAYIRLSQLSQKVDDKLKYANKAKEIRETKTSLANIYEINKDLYDKTKKEEYRKIMKQTQMKISNFESPSYRKSVALDRE